ncbi:MAG: type II toxin-antitoxin system RelE/ParE family toxin [Ignavibacteriae bacterium]|nr:type II toxin-antitoxin system RelE/ParE family toxin [Ignavibacteriota bacterium]
MFEVELSESAISDLSSVSSIISERIIDKLEWLGSNFDNIPHFRLHGKEWKNCYKLRVGDYRIIYQIVHTQRTIFVQRIQHRKEVYKDRN